MKLAGSASVAPGGRRCQTGQGGSRGVRPRLRSGRPGLGVAVRVLAALDPGQALGRDGRLGAFLGQRGELGEPRHPALDADLALRAHPRRRIQAADGQVDALGLDDDVAEALSHKLG